MKLKEIILELERFAPLGLQESFDNSGLLIGNINADVTGALLTIDVTEHVLDEAIAKKTNLIIAHHPLIFSPIKTITGKNEVERIIIKAIKNDISIYAGHTNFDSVLGGVNSKIAEKIGLNNTRILSSQSGKLKKLVFYVPLLHSEEVRKAVLDAGAGHIGNYDNCSYNTEGFGTFRALDKAKPYVGVKGNIHSEKEVKVETVFPEYLKGKVVSALVNSHPYEEVAYDIYQLENLNKNTGLGIVGELPKSKPALEFLKDVKEIFNVGAIKYTDLLNKKIKKVALCGGSGSFLINAAIRSNADIFITGDVKYHQFFEAENKIIIADIGHFESEQYTKDIFYEILSKKFPTFALYFSEVNTNPIKYL